jgi:hypothetical protein
MFANRRRAGCYGIGAMKPTTKPLLLALAFAVMALAASSCGGINCSPCPNGMHPSDRSWKCSACVADGTGDAPDAAIDAAPGGGDAAADPDAQTDTSLDPTGPDAPADMSLDTTGPDASVDTSVPDASLDTTGPDASLDMSVPDAPLDVSVPDAPLDVSDPDASLDLSDPDASVDTSGSDVSPSDGGADALVD